MAQPGPFPGFTKTICWGMGTKPLRVQAELSTWVFHFLFPLLRHGSSFTFCPYTDTGYKEEYLSLLYNENGSVLNLVPLEVKHYINIQHVRNHLSRI